MVKVEYIGKKPVKTDTSYGTGIVWSGKGDVKEVPADKWELMKKHTDVWQVAGPREPLHIDIEYALTEKHSEALKREAEMTPEELQEATDKAVNGESEPLPVDIEYALSAEHSYALRQEEAKAPKSAAKLFAKMTDEEVRAYVKTAVSKTLHHKLSGENLRAKALEALKEA